jgi:hypothetical protein
VDLAGGNRLARLGGIHGDGGHRFGVTALDGGVGASHHELADAAVERGHRHAAADLSRSIIAAESVISLDFPRLVGFYRVPDRGEPGGLCVRFRER